MGHYASEMSDPSDVPPLYKSIPIDKEKVFNKKALKLLSEAMSNKLEKKFNEGRGNWFHSSTTREDLSRMLKEHVEKGDPVDVANFCMMLYYRGETIG